MTKFLLQEVATPNNFFETGYLSANPDVKLAVAEGHVASGRAHFDQFGKRENRFLRRDASFIAKAKQKKMERIADVLRSDMPCVKEQGYFDFLSKELRQVYNIIDVEAVSANGYDQKAQDLIEDYSEGLVLDCGAGRRPVYYDNVVNFEIVPYDTTDVLGVGESLPFADDSFNAVLSIAVLEHVKDPFLCAREIARVLKPGGELFCSVPFLQPLHAYPHHYYNMTHQGVANLFDGLLDEGSFDVYGSLLPVNSLMWILRSWVDGLKGTAKSEFLNMSVENLIGDPNQMLDRSFVKSLSKEKNLELASGTLYRARKPT